MTSSSKFRFLMISAMYENGGNTTQRILDGHSALRVYPFESQVGTKYVVDELSSEFPIKYRWPVIPSGVPAETIYEAIIDEECKVRLKTPNVSKFRDHPMQLSDAERKECFVRLLNAMPEKTPAAAMEAFFRSTFEVWRDFYTREAGGVYVGYSPIISVDAGRILQDMPSAHVLHVVRNPFSAYADTKKRPMPLPLDRYVFSWTHCLHRAQVYQRRHPGRVHIVRFEDVVNDRRRALAPLLDALGVAYEPALEHPSWNGKRLEQVYPWGTIRFPTPEQNMADAKSLTQTEGQAIADIAGAYLDEFGYGEFRRLHA